MNLFMRLVFSRSRARTITAISFAMAFALIAGCVGSKESELSGNSSKASASLNLCVGQVANSFHCIDDTRFQHCTGDATFVVNSCPAGLCATRTPAIKNPCVGRERAAEIDGVEPPAPGKASPPANAGATNDANNNNAGANNAGANNAGANTGAVNNGAANNNGGACVGGPAFDPAGAKNVGNGRGIQFIGGQCRSSADCASGCCAGPCGICSGIGAQFQAGKTGCGFGD
jgi:hypothetical protein